MNTEDVARHVICISLIALFIIFIFLMVSSVLEEPKTTISFEVLCDHEKELGMVVYEDYSIVLSTEDYNKFCGE